MVRFSSVTSRLGSVTVSAARWLAPSIAAACAGAVAAGVFEGIGVVADDQPLAIAATTGFASLVILPVLAAVSIVLRAVWAAWRPGKLVAELVEDGGGTPRLAAWTLVAWLALVGLASAAFQSTWFLASWTSFKPLVISFSMPVMMVLVAFGALALSRPVANLLTHLARKLDARWLRDGRRQRSLFTPTKIAISALIVTAGVGYLIWRLGRARLGPMDVSLAYGPALGVAALVAVHLTWRAIARMRWVVGIGLATAAAAAILTAVVATTRHPSLTLEIWGERPIAGLAIERLFELETIRGNMSIAQFRPGTRPDAPHPDIVLITIDTVRADRTPPYQGKALMPGLRALGERGMVFEWAFAPGNVTRRSIPAMAIGLQPNRIRGRVVGWALRVDPRHVLLAERLRAGGYDTAGFMCCEGFWGPEARTGLQRGLEHVEIEKTGLTLARRARVWLAERDKLPNRRPLFLWMHILEPHGWPSASGEPHSDEERLRFYDRSLTAADNVLVELLGAFSNRAPARAPLVIVTADHGEGLGDHGQPYHSTDLYNSQIHVPLVIAGPGITPGRALETVSLVDLVPTIVELAGFVPPSGPSIDGRSIAPLATGARVSDPEGGIAFAAMIKDRSNPGGVSAIVRGKWKLVADGITHELYDIRADPGEKFNLITRMPNILAELRKLLLDRLKAATVSPF